IALLLDELRDSTDDGVLRVGGPAAVGRCLGLHPIRVSAGIAEDLAMGDYVATRWDQRQVSELCRLRELALGRGWPVDMELGVAFDELDRLCRRDVLELPVAPRPVDRLDRR